jgi:hypothetical protein
LDGREPGADDEASGYPEEDEKESMIDQAQHGFLLFFSIETNGTIVITE